MTVQTSLGWGSATNLEEVPHADLSAASFHPRQLLHISEFLSAQALQTKEADYSKAFQSTSTILNATHEALSGFYKPVSAKAQGRGGKVASGRGEKFYLPKLGLREAFEQQVSGTITSLYNNLCRVLPDMAERAFGRATAEETGPLFLEHKNMFDIYGRFCHFYVEALRDMYPGSPLAKGELVGPLPGHQKYPLLYVKDGGEYLLSPRAMTPSPVGLEMNYFAPTVARPYMESCVLYDKEGQVTRGWGLLLNFAPGYTETHDLGYGPVKLLLNWHVRLYSPNFHLSPVVKKFGSEYFLPESKPYRETYSETPVADEAMVDNLFAASVQAFLETGDKRSATVVEYLPLPTTPQEQRVWRLLTLESERSALLDAQGTPFDVEPAREEEGSSAAPASFAQEIEQVTAEIESLEAQLLEDEIRTQQEAVSARVAKDARKAQSKSARGGKGRGAKRGASKAVQGSSSSHAGASSSCVAVAPLEPTPEMVSVAKARVEALKIDGRVKWRTLLGYVSKLTREGLVRSEDVRVSGSHVTMHTQGGAPVTLVRPHGRRDAVHGRVASDALMQLILSSQNAA